MIRVSLLTSVVLILTGLVCCNDETGLDQELLTGRIGGEEWKFQYAKAFYDSFNEEFQVEMYGEHESAIDPCTINSINGYLSVTLPNETGTYSLPFAEEAKSVKFHQAGVGQQFFVATSGFVEVISISGRRVGGYLQATFDEENTVEGSFVFDRCN